MISSAVFVRQRDHYDCGAACLTMLLRNFGQTAELAEVQRAIAAQGGELGASAILRAARAWGLQARAIKVPEPAWPSLPTPAILHVEPGHYVVLAAIDDGGARILDPAWGERQLAPTELTSIFRGVVLDIRPGPDFEVGASRRRKPAAAALLRGHGRSIAGWIAASAGASTMAILAARHVWALVTSPAPTPVGGLVACAFALAFWGLRSLAGRLSMRLLVRVDASLSRQALAAVLAEPLSTLRRRGRKQLLLAASASTMFRRALGPRPLQSLLDGLLAPLWLIAAAAISPWYAAVGLLSLVAQIWIAMGQVVGLRSRVTALTAAEDRARAVVADILDHADAIKGAGTEAAALAAHARAATAESAALTAVGDDSARYGANLDALTLAPALAGLLATSLHLGAEALTPWWLLGAAFALVFGVSTAGAAKTLVDVGHIAGVLEQVAASFDPASRTREPEGADRPPREPSAAPLGIAAEDLSWSEPLTGRRVLEGVSFHLAPGEALLIRGPAGSGKSTLCDLIAGHAILTAGRLGATTPEGSTHVPTSALPSTQVRVLRADPMIHEGTVHTNLTGHRRDLDHADLDHALELVELQGVATALPLGLATPLGRLSGVLSEGQRQRLALARALLQAPAVLVLDGALNAVEAERRARMLRRLRARIPFLIVTSTPGAAEDPDAFTQVLELDHGHDHD